MGNSGEAVVGAHGAPVCARAGVRRGVAAALLGLLVAGALAGCGGASESGAGGANPAANQQWQFQARVEADRSVLFAANLYFPPQEQVKVHDTTVVTISLLASAVQPAPTGATGSPGVGPSTSSTPFFSGAVVGLAAAPNSALSVQPQSAQRQALVSAHDQGSWNFAVTGLAVGDTQETFIATAYDGDGDTALATKEVSVDIDVRNTASNATSSAWHWLVGVAGGLAAIGALIAAGWKAVSWLRNRHDRPGAHAGGQ
ncbi:MAG TPA: hypothetical protein VGC04_06110 [Cellulomonas sp.]